MAAASQTSARAQEIQAQFRSSVLQSVIASAEGLTCGGARATARSLVNFLRGSLPPPEAAVEAGIQSLHGLLEAFAAAWLHELVERLVDEGFLAPAAGAGSRASSLAPTGKRASFVGDGRKAPEPWVAPAKPGDRPELEEPLRALRRSLARAEGRPPFSIFSNRVLAELALRRPGTLAELAEVRGMGEARVRLYGRKVLAALRKASGGS
ncbi:MAG TPA: HRDC domain-containing protein [Planctomycetota bacterium]|nr:HRDC domain-containing protein [Planctomycetota bacterium]